MMTAVEETGGVSLSETVSVSLPPHTTPTHCGGGGGGEVGYTTTTLPRLLLLLHTAGGGEVGYTTGGDGQVP